MVYQEPIMEVIEFSRKNIVCESNIKGNEEGDGPSGSINDFF